VVDRVRRQVGEQLDFKLAFGSVESGVGFVGHQPDCIRQRVWNPFSGSGHRAALSKDTADGAQLSEGRFAWSMTMTSTGTFRASSFRPSLSCKAVKIDGPGTASGGGGGRGTPDF